MIGYLKCRECGQEYNCADIVGGLCPECARSRIDHLVTLQKQYETALRAGETGTSERAAQLIREYQQQEGVRLKDVPGAYRVK